MSDPNQFEFSELSLILEDEEDEEENHVFGDEMWAHVNCRMGPQELEVEEGPEIKQNTRTFEGLEKSLVNQFYGSFKMKAPPWARSRRDSDVEPKSPDELDPVPSLNQLILKRREEKEECVCCDGFVHPDDSHGIERDGDWYCSVECLNDDLNP